VSLLVSRNPLAFRGLCGQQGRLDQLTLAAHGHARKALVPLAFGHVRLRVEPSREQLELRRWNLAALNAIEQMLKQRGRKIRPADFRHGRSDAVEAACQSLLDASGFNGIGRRRELLRQQSQLLRTKAVSLSFKCT